METRKIMSLGSSMAVTLPKYWLNSNNLSKGESVTMTVQRDKTLLVRSAKDPNLLDNRELHILVGFEEDEDSIVWQIIAGFLNGYSTIKLTSNRYFTLEQNAVIRKITSRLYMMIVEADVGRITINTLLDESKASVVSSVERMHIITYSMCKDILGSFVSLDRDLIRAISTLEDDVDQLMFLVLRLIRLAAINPSLADKLGLDSFDCLDFQTLVHRIARIAFHIAQMGESLIAIMDKEIPMPENVLSIIQEAAEIAFNTYDKAVRAFLMKDLTHTNEIINTQNRINELYSKITPIPYFGKYNDLSSLSQIVTIREGVKKISHYSADIAELAINRTYN